MRLRATLTTGAIAGLLLVGLPTAAQADDDVVRYGNYTVRAGTTIDGNLIVRNGTLTIYGTVDGNVGQSGSGSVHVMRSGEVDGNITEYGTGGVSVAGEVDGNIAERDSGDVIIDSTGDVDGNVGERSSGTVRIRGDVDGNVGEAGTGHLVLGHTARVDGNVTEYESGDLHVWRGARVAGDIRETGAGSYLRR